LDRHGSPRLVRLQPASTCDLLAINAWLSVFSIISKGDDATEMRVRYSTDEGRDVTAFIIPGNSMMDISPEDGDVTLYMYARSIIEDKTRRI